MSGINKTVVMTLPGSGKVVRSFTASEDLSDAQIKQIMVNRGAVGDVLVFDTLPTEVLESAGTDTTVIITELGESLIHRFVSDRVITNDEVLWYMRDRGIRMGSQGVKILPTPQPVTID